LVSQAAARSLINAESAMEVTPALIALVFPMEAPFLIAAMFVQVTEPLALAVSLRMWLQSRSLWMAALKAKRI
jgi:hypothetical protein